MKTKNEMKNILAEVEYTARTLCKTCRFGNFRFCKNAFYW